MNPLYLLLAIPFFIVLIGLEVLVSWRQRKRLYRFNDAITNLNIGIGNQAFNLFFKVLLLGAYLWIYQHWAFWHIPANAWTFILCLFAFDFIFYWAHRWSHEINFWWGAHVVHHSSEEFNLSVALRQSWFHNLLAFFLFLPLPFFGFDPVMFFIVAAAHTLYQFWIHTETIDKLWAPIEWIFNTPSHHRVHHGRDPKYIDKNHAGVFIIWDRMFGTFQPEEERPTYGITTPINSWNPVWANFHYYVEMAVKMTRIRRLRDKLKFFVARPGWMPEDMGGMQPIPEVDKTTHRKYDTETPLWVNLYVLFNFVLIVVGLSALMYNFSDLSVFYQVSFFGLLMLSTLICGGIMENRAWVLPAEYLRLALLLLCLNSYYYFWSMEWFGWMLAGSLAVGLLMLVWFTLVNLSKLREFGERVRG